MDSDFSIYDIILCTIGIAHISTDPKMEQKYYAINRDLPILIAKKAKMAGVKQFVFFSSMIVFGDDLQINETLFITNTTKPKPSNFYGKSKLEAEIQLLQLVSEDFCVTVIRTPMVYGENCKGNFQKLISFSRKAMIFPDIPNQRSMIYIFNLCEFVLNCLYNNITGIVYPQNSEYVGTSSIIECARKCQGKSVHFITIFNPLLYLVSRRIGLIRKIFGSRIYDRKLSPNIEAYNIFTFEESIQRCVQSIKTVP
ncbi:UDP-glucose 4-epimerase [Treponema primitia ZAS-2]|uniref:UDP-glucose 4-epimerase n=2 Tax=Treponema primitia TaxID=88058 RepID=F5YN30_TREPZ|nr:NAD-dependent epimerase/dehydratase family protein [Treponema primitia]AEF84816.1 UDP-glucose 4-epimerase [Treponema primitia ZAS-2]